MNLAQYDGQCVRIIDTFDEVFDGICTYNNEEYNEHEFGCCEESLELINMIFYKSQIKSVESLENHTGPYGKFLDPYGTLEEMTIQDGIDSIKDVMFCEEDVHVIRLLNCLDKYLDPYYGYTFPWREETIDALCELYQTTENEAVRNEAERLIDMWK